jgi:hypothetical protein
MKSASFFVIECPVTESFSVQYPRSSRAGTGGIAVDDAKERTNV